MEFLVSILAATVQSGTPVLYATLGEMFTERAGVLNLGVEGLMITGAFIAFIVVYSTGNPWLAALAAGAGAALFAAIHGLICLVFQGNQVVSGLALTIFGLGFADYLGTPYLGTATEGFRTFSVPFLGDIPLLGPIFFQHDALVNLSYFIAPALWLILHKTALGLSLRATGENPATAISSGINAIAMRWIGILVGGFLVGLGGAYLSLAYTHLWTPNLTAGRGWIAVALVIFAFWRPGRAVFGAYLFGGVMALQLRLQALGSALPSSLMLMLPYILTLVALVWASARGKGQNAPMGLGINIPPRE